jgi:hypothetical protein
MQLARRKPQLHDHLRSSRHPNDLRRKRDRDSL